MLTPPAVYLCPSLTLLLIPSTFSPVCNKEVGKKVFFKERNIYLSPLTIDSRLKNAKYPKDRKRKIQALPDNILFQTTNVWIALRICYLTNNIVFLSMYIMHFKTSNLLNCFAFTNLITLNGRILRNRTWAAAHS